MTPAEPAMARRHIIPVTKDNIINTKTLENKFPIFEGNDGFVVYSY
jgi:hypothetical protein